MKTKKLSERKLKQLLKEYDPQKIINKHIRREINLTGKQITMLIKLRDKVKKNG